MSELAETQKLIAEVCDEVKNLLLEKNAAYGNSALDPLRVFSKADPVEQIKVRIDDKLKRIATTGQRTAEGRVTDEDTFLDLIGYLVLLRVAERMTGKKVLAPLFETATMSGFNGILPQYHQKPR